MILLIKGEPLGGKGLTGLSAHLSSLTFSLQHQSKPFPLLFYSV